jgi:hypothetical protein
MIRDCTTENDHSFSEPVDSTTDSLTFQKGDCEVIVAKALVIAIRRDSAVPALR